MAEIVHLNDVFDNNVLLKRMEYAFDRDGSDFWQRFFLCQGRHPNDKIIYLFTLHQLKVIHDWLDRQVNNRGNVVGMNLDLSRMIFFNTPVEESKRNSYGFYKMRACYLSYEDNKPDEPNVRETFRFSSSPPEKEKNGWDEFFDKKFKKSLSNVPAWSKDRQKTVFELVKLKTKIGTKILPAKPSKWLRYLGGRIIEKDHKSIEYCQEVDPSCPLVGAVAV
jgi:hypothetical protein